MKRGGAIKMRLLLWVERGSCLGFGGRVGMRKIRNIARQKKDAKRVVYMAMDQKAWEVVSCLELPNNRLRRREMLLGQLS